MAVNKEFSDASDYIQEVTKLPECIDFKAALAAIKKYHSTIFEVGGYK